MFTSLLSMIFQSILWFALHIEDKNTFPKPLPAQKELELFKLASTGNKEAKDKLILHNLRLVAHIVKKYYASGEDPEELISIGTIGLIKAVSTFDHEKGNRFAAYGSRCIDNEILMYFRAIKKAGGNVHFDEPIDVDKDGNQLTLIDIIASEGDLCDEVDLKIHSEELKAHVNTLLDDREREIIILRYGLCGARPLTQRECADLLGISRSYVSRIEKRAIEKLAAKMR
ncbi:MAG: RNA polymerase sporulation sigma factor SigK [Oscillospiraceae bacterium]|nr:RNA polymerase sporulation sigma factor SigK [Oscillospiraceae bacterium]